MTLNLKDKYAIVGVGNTAYGKVPGVSALSHAVEACRLAIEDAGIEKAEVDAVLTKAPTANFQMLWSTKVAQRLGIIPRATGTMDAAGASNINLIAYACMLIETGQANAAVISYGDNPATGSRAAYSRLHDDDSVHGLYGAPSNYALVARRHMYEYGTTHDQLGAVAVNARRNAAKNPNAQFREPITLEDYHNSRWLAEPFHLLDSCPVSDGGAALVVTSAERARDLKQKPISILGFGQSHPAWDIAARRVWTTSGAKESSRSAFQMAEITTEDVDFVEFYDCFTIVPIITLEDYGFCEKGEGGAFVESGRIALDGDLPLNTSGGLLSETGMPGMQLILEGVRQLRGECGERQVRDARIGVISNQGGIMTTHATLVLRN